MGDQASPFDVTFTITGGETFGFMLSTPQGESKQLEMSEAPGPEAERMSTQAIATAQDFNPKLDTPFAMSDFTGGCGQLEYDLEDDTAYWWSTGIITHNRGKVYPAPPASSLALTGSTGDITNTLTYITAANVRYDFLWEGINLWRRDATNSANAWVKVYASSVAIRSFKIMDNVGFIFVPTLTGTTDFLYQSDVTAAATWTPTTRNHTPFSDALGKPAYAEHVRGTFYVVRELAGVSNGVFYNIDPTADSWAGPIDTTLEGNISGAPGEETYPVTGLVAVGDFLFVVKKNAIYSIDSQQDVIEIIWQWKDKPSEQNFKYFSTGGDLLMFNVGPEVYMYDPTTGVNQALGLARKDGFSIKEINGIANDNQYTYVLATVRVPTIRSADCSAILRGVRGRGNRYTWEVVWEDTSLSGKTYHRLSAFPFGAATRLYWALNGSSDTSTYLMDIPASWDETSTGAYSTSSTIWTSISRAGFPGFIKRHLYWNSNHTSLDEQNTIGLKYTLDQGTNYLTVGNANETNARFDYSSASSASIGFRFEFTSNGTTCPVLNDFDHHQRVRFKYLPSIKIALRLANSVELRNKAKSNKTVWELWEDLIELRTSDDEIIYRDFLGNEFIVTIDSIGVRPSRHQQINEFEEEAIVFLTRADRGA